VKQDRGLDGSLSWTRLGLKADSSGGSRRAGGRPGYGGAATTQQCERDQQDGSLGRTESEDLWASVGGVDRRD